MDFYKIGKISFFITAAILAALVILNSLTLAHTPQVETNKNKIKAAKIPKSDSVRIPFLTRTKIEKPLDSHHVANRAVVQVKKGKPFAYLYNGDQYIVDQTGLVLCHADSMNYIDLPIIHAPTVLVDSAKIKIIDATVLEALTFVSLCENKKHTPQLSEILIEKENGIVCYFELDRVYPVIVGSGNMHQKVNYIESFFSRMMMNDVCRSAKYIDVRVDGQIIVKKNV